MSIYIIGSSHASRLHQELKSIIKPNAILINLTRPGATFEYLSTIDWTMFTKNDTIVLQIFGNDLFQNNTKINRTTGKRELTSFKPKLGIEHKITQLKRYIHTCKTQNIFLIDHIYRHIKGDPEIEGVFSFQTQFNRKLRSYLKDKVKILDHRHLLGHSKSWIRSLHNYNKLLVDGVHFHREIYKNMACRLLDVLNSSK